MPANLRSQPLLFPDADAVRDQAASTFIDNMRLPVHRWFRYSAGFSAEWVERVIAEAAAAGPVSVLDPFAGAGTTLLAAEKQEIPACGVEAHPFVARIARTKLLYRSDADAFRERARDVKRLASKLRGVSDDYPPLIGKCFDAETLEYLDHLRRAWEQLRDDTPASELVWLTLVAILRLVSHVGTAPWQYVLPRKSKRAPLPPEAAFDLMTRTIHADMQTAATVTGPRATLLESDARTCAGVPDGFTNLVITSPPYANNYDYADATRLEMCVMREINGWSDLQGTVRRRLVRSCSQHVPESAVNLNDVLASEELQPIQREINDICGRLGEIRKEKGGRKTYHLMVACYFQDMAQVWRALRRVCQMPSRVCFVLGDSAPYGVYVPVVEWTGELAKAAGFQSFCFEKTRDRHV
jgi:hypothetical protein